MKNKTKQIVLSLAIAPVFFTATAQEPQKPVKAPKVKKLYAADSVLSRWCIDVNFLGGIMTQDFTTAASLGNYLNAVNSNAGDLKFSNGTSMGGDLQLGYFFGRKRHFGIGTGIMYLAQQGDATLSNYHVEYQATDYNNHIYRQVITPNGDIKESLKNGNLNIPLLLKYKKRFSKVWGFSADAGLLFNMQLKSSYTSDASFNYEAIYKYDLPSASYVYDNATTALTSDYFITKANYIRDNTNNPNGNVYNYFDTLRKEGNNVGLNVKPAKNTGDVSYKTFSVGFIVRPTVNVYLSDNVSLNFGVYYMMQPVQKDATSGYTLTGKVGDYNSLQNNVTNANVQSYGVNIGARFFFGKAKDRDHDGVPDRLDQCPDDSGLVMFHGCPDTDGDGIPDREDSCPTVKGIAKFHGCPDSDGDGIPDKLDACPYQAGPEKTHGCPDRDGDGILDKDDTCPDVPGLVQFHGCPDTDGDGVPDNEDKCPTEAGPASNQGCPLPPPPPPAPAPEQIDIATEVLFDLNKVTIKKSCYPGLEAIVKKLQNNPEAFVQIDGYTDNTGTKAYNKKLSLKRAAVVKLFLQKHGASAKQLKAKGHGDKSPAASNKTKEGRAQNRRAVINIKDK